MSGGTQTGRIKWRRENSMPLQRVGFWLSILQPEVVVVVAVVVIVVVVIVLVPAAVVMTSL